MEAPPPLLGVAAGSSPAAPEATPLTVAPTPPVTVAPAWPRSAQWATAGLLLLALGLLGWHAVGLRWGTRPTEPVANAGRIDLNHADRAQLLQLPDIGETTAERIEEYRQSHNGFKSVDELRQVRGIGPALLERLRPLVEVRPYDAPPDVADAPPPAPAAPVVHRDAPAKADKPASVKKKGDGPAEPIDINTAGADELRQLPGIGPALSARIIQAREQRPFQSVDELHRVKGIGVKTLESLRPFVKVGD